MRKKEKVSLDKKSNSRGVVRRPGRLKRIEV